MIRHLTLALVVCFGLGSAGLEAANKEQGRLENCGVVMQEILDVPDNIPQELLEKAECVIVIPSMTKVAIGIGGSYGRGAMVVPIGQGLQRTVGRAGDVLARGWQLRPAAGRGVDGRGVAGHEPPRRRRAARAARSSSAATPRRRPAPKVATSRRQPTRRCAPKS